MKIIGADHTNWRVRDLDASLAFYRGVLGFEVFGVEEYESGERPFVSLRVAEDFILHLVPDAGFEGGGGFDHLAFTVEGGSVDGMVEHLEKKATVLKVKESEHEDTSS